MMPANAIGCVVKECGIGFQATLELPIQARSFQSRLKIGR